MGELNIKSVLGGISSEQFLAEYWQKKPLLIRQAVPDFRQGLLTLDELFEYAMQEDVISRLVTVNQGCWRLAHGPFTSRQLKQLPAQEWTLLVQNVNHLHPQVEALLRSFSFIPYARLDDVMVSYAPPQGGIGAHVDSYDVFLLQGMGRKEWQIAQHYDEALLPDCPLKILQNFQAEETYVLEPGDMLYLPPSYAHYGTALDAGMTYSIGFRAPSTQELSQGFLMYLQDHLQLQGMYADPDLQRQESPALISSQMQEKCHAQLASIKWDAELVQTFLGCYLSEPKAHVFFDAPNDLFSFDDFVSHLAREALCVNPKAQLLYDERNIYLNGEVWCIPCSARPQIINLANSRCADFSLADEELQAILFQEYDSGVLYFCNT